MDWHGGARLDRAVARRERTPLQFAMHYLCTVNDCGPHYGVETSCPRMSRRRPWKDHGRITLLNVLFHAQTDLAIIHHLLVCPRWTFTSWRRARGKCSRRGSRQ
eukprot:5979908-Pyramimonas_sp.AAC.1